MKRRGASGRRWRQELGSPGWTREVREGDGAAPASSSLPVRAGLKSGKAARIGRGWSGDRRGSTWLLRPREQARLRRADSGGRAVGGDGWKVSARERNNPVEGKGM